MSEPRYTVGQVLPNGVVITAELLEAIVKLESAGVNPADDARLNALLRQSAEEHSEILRRSRECKCYFDGDGVRHMRGHCPMHTVYR